MIVMFIRWLEEKWLNTMALGALPPEASVSLDLMPPHIDEVVLAAHVNL